MPTGNIQLGNGTILFNGLSAGVTTISEAEITTEGNFSEKDFKLDGNRLILVAEVEEDYKKVAEDYVISNLDYYYIS